MLFLLMMQDPNPGDPLNKDAAHEMKADMSKFERSVKRSLRGESVDGVSFDRVLP